MPPRRHLLTFLCSVPHRWSPWRNLHVKRQRQPSTSSDGHWESTSILVRETEEYIQDCHCTVIPPPSSLLSLIQSEKPHLPSTSQRTTKGNISNLLYVISSCLSSLHATFLHLPQGFSPTAYLLHRISRPSDGNTAKTHLWPLTAHTVTTCIASQALLTAIGMSSSDLLPPASSDLLTV